MIAQPGWEARLLSCNAAEEWTRDVSEYVTNEIRFRCDRQGIDIPAHLEAFMDSHENRDQRQLMLRLV
jgi:hypothetical protein